MKQQQLQPQVQFTNREEELGAVAYRLEILHGGGGVFQCVVNFYGIPGIGKTRLLVEILHRAQTGSWSGRQFAPTPSALTDLAGEHVFLYPDRGGPEVLAHQMRQLEQQTKQHDAQFFKALKTFRAFEAPSPYDEEAWYTFRQEAKRVADAFSLYVYRHAKQQRQPVMLLFDNSEKLPVEAFDWLEYEVFSPLVQTDRILLVVAGRSPVRWKRFEIRRRVLLHKLDLLPPKEREQLVIQQAPSWERLAPNIVKLTFGYPWGNQTIVEALEQLGKPQVIEPDDFEQYRPELLRRLTTEVVESRLLEDIAPDLRCAFHIIAPLRQFDVTTLRAVLPEFAPDQFGERGGNYFLMMLNRLVDTALVEWSAKRKAYVLDDTLRRILALDLETQDADLSQCIHQRGAELYRRWLEEVSESRSTYLVEWLYHRAQVLRLGGKDQAEIASKVQRDLRTVLDRFYRQATFEDDRLLDSASRLVNELEWDDELTTLVGQRAMSRMVQAVKEAIPALKAKPSS
jgi:hypothetical protein